MELLLSDFFAIGVCLTWMLISKACLKPYPPGPKGLPLIGNMLDMPTSHEWLKATEWKKMYGDIVFLKVLGKSVVFLNSYKAATDLMEKHSSACSSRPHSHMGDLIKWDWFMAVMPYGETWRKHRTCTQKVLDPVAVADVAEQQVTEAAKLLNNLVRTPKDFLRHIRGSVTSTIMLITYGHEVKSGNDPYVILAEKTSAIFSDAARPGAFLVEVIPWLKVVPVWFPGAYFRRLAERGFELSQEMKFRPYRDMKEKVLNGTARPSVISRLIEESMAIGNMIEDEEKIANVAGMLYAAGADALTSVVETFFLAMVLHPEVQYLAQKEIDRVVGNDRLPNLQDRENLPYVNAICSECLRWEPVTPIGVPHALSDEVEYKGYAIPKGSTIIANQWLILNDPKEYPHPEIFNPERFLSQGDVGSKLPRDPMKVAFGFGRRICPGRFMAMNTIFITISSILTTLDIKKKVGVDRVPIIPKGDYIPGFTRHPKPFDCDIKLRSQKCGDLIQQYLDN